MRKIIPEKHRVH